MIVGLYMPGHRAIGSDHSDASKKPETKGIKYDKRAIAS